MLAVPMTGGDGPLFPDLVFEPEDPEVVARRERQQEWRARAVEKIHASRRWRLEQLREQGDALRRALQAYEQVDDGNVISIALRPEFVHLDKARPRRPGSDGGEAGPVSARAARARRAADVATRPPATRLVQRRSNALSFYLTAVYLAHLRTPPGQAFRNTLRNVQAGQDPARSWAVLTGLAAPQSARARHARVRRALDDLVTAGLVAIQPPGARYRYEDWRLLDDDGSGRLYRVPGERVRTGVRLPPAFFLNGWHLVLDPAELVMLFAVMDLNWRVNWAPEARAETGDVQLQPWVALPDLVRWARYGISGEVYERGHQLHEFGLLHWHDPMPERRRGKVRPSTVPAPPLALATPNDVAVSPETGIGAGGHGAEHTAQSRDPLPYQFAPADPAVYDRSAIEVVTTTLSAFPTPYRLSELCGLIEPQAAVRDITRSTRRR